MTRFHPARHLGWAAAVRQPAMAVRSPDNLDRVWAAFAIVASIAVLQFQAPQMDSADATVSERDEPAVGTRAVVEAITVGSTGPCLDAERLADRTAMWLGRDELDARIDVEAFVEAGRAGFVVVIDDETRAERWLDPAPDDCADLHAALGLAIALGLDASVLAAFVDTPHEQPVPGPPPALAVDEERAPNLDAAPPASVPPPEPVRVGIDVEAQALVGVLPSAAFGGSVGVEARPRAWIDLRTAVWGAAGLPIAVGDGTTVPAMVAAALSACPGRTMGRVRLRLCVGAGVGAVIARGRTFDDEQTTALPWVAGIAGGDVAVGLSRRVAFTAGADLVAPFIRPRLVVRNPGGIVVDAAAAPAAGGTFGIGVRLRLN